MRPPTPLQNSYSSFEEEEGHFEVEDQMWSARDRTIIAKTKQYLEESRSLRVEIEELESLLGPERIRMWILDESWKKQGTKKICAIYESFRTDGPSELLVVSRSRWDKHQRRQNAPWRPTSSPSSCERQWQEDLEEQRVGWSSLERKVMGQWKITWRNFVITKVDIESLESFMEPEDEEVSLRYILQYSTRGGSNISSFLSQQIKRTTSWQAEKMVRSTAR